MKLERIRVQNARSNGEGWVGREGRGVRYEQCGTIEGVSYKPSLPYLKLCLARMLDLMMDV